MKKVILLTICLVFVFVSASFAAPPKVVKCKCDPELVTYQGLVKWFCCMFPDGSAKVTVKNSAGKVVSRAATKADGSFSGSFKAARANICPEDCCILWDTYTASCKSCVCVIGNAGKSDAVKVSVTDCKQKDVAINFFTICEQMVSCTDC